MAASTTYCTQDQTGSESPRLKTRLSTQTGVDDAHLVVANILCTELLPPLDIHKLTDNHSSFFVNNCYSPAVKRASLGRLRHSIDAPPPYDNIPPTYEESLSDQPPDYTNTDSLASPSAFAVAVDKAAKYNARPNGTPALLPDPKFDVDLSNLAPVREHVTRKKKQEQKKAQQAKWAGSDNEGDGARGGDGGDMNGGNDGGGEGGDDGGGDGGDGDGGGDDGDFWNSGGNSKKNKKSKKKAKEEEEAKKREEEEAAAIVESSVWDEIPGDMPSTNGGDGVGAANPDDEWGMAPAGKKGKKGKKNKVSQYLGHLILYVLVADGPGCGPRSSTSSSSSSPPSHIHGPKFPRYQP